jgi:hypothetical protein
VVLGAQNADSPILQPQLKAKLSRSLAAPVPDTWATLGMANDGPILWQGVLEFSENGNTSSAGKTLEQIKTLYSINHELDGVNSIVLERCISFDKIRFPDFPQTFSADVMPLLRLTLFLQPDEGALVFYQHYKNHYNPAEEQESDIQHILPEATPGYTTERDRLTYIFPVLPPQKITTTSIPGVFKLSGEELQKSFVIKVLTFKRDNADHTPATIMKEVVNTVNAGRDGHRLLKYSYKDNAFFEVNNNDWIIDPGAKTLLLIHGTFSNTDKSYNGLMAMKYDNGKRSWLQKTMQSYGYMQVLAFDHETVSCNAGQNIAYLRQILGATTFRDNAQIDVVTTSRGGLVGKYLVCLMDSDQLPVRRMANIACANGVGYFDVGRNIVHFLGIYKSVLLAGGNVLPGLITGLAQFSADYFLHQPGCLQMTINDPSLTQILNAKPRTNQNKIRIQPIVGDWDASLVADHPLFKRLAERGIDAIIRHLLGEENDWVVGTAQQRIAMADYSNAPVQVRSMHVKYLNLEYCTDNVHQKLWDFFSAP